MRRPKEEYVTDGKRLYRIESKLPGGRGYVLEDARTAQLTSIPVKAFLELEAVERLGTR